MESGPALVASRPRLTLVRDTGPLTQHHMAARAAAGEDGVVGATAGKTCSCGHERQAHQHYRRGTDCALCDCARFQRRLLTRLLGR